MLPRRVISGLALAGAAIVSIGWWTKLEIDQLASEFGAAAQAQEFLATAADVRGAIANPAAHPYVDLRASFEKMLRLTSENADQQRRLQRLATVLEQRTSMAAREFMTSVDLLLDEVEIEARDSLQRRNSSAARSSQRADLVLALGAFVTLVTISWSGVVSYRHIRASRNAELSLAELQHNTESILSAAGQGVCHFDTNGTIAYVNGAAAHLLGWDPAELLGQRGHELLHHSRPDGSPYPVDECPIKGTIETGKAQRIKGEVYWKKDGTSIPVEYVCTPIRKAGKITGGLVTFTDVSTRDRTMNELQKANAQLVTSMRELERRSLEIKRFGELAGLLQSSRSIEEASKVTIGALSDLFPGRSGAICLISASRNIVEVISQSDNYSSNPVFAPDDCWALRRGKLHHTTESNAPDVCSHTHGARASNLCIPMIAQGDTMGVFHFGGDSTFSEEQQRLALAVSEQATLVLANLRLQERLRQQSIRDPLTGLFNRRYLEESAERELRRAERHRRPLAVIMMDIDHFKRFNDTFGHEAGDAMLREVGQLLLASVRAEDIVCRYGGEELALVMPDASFEHGYERAVAIKELLKHMDFRFEGKVLGSVTISMGMAMYPQHGDSWSAILHSADLALYRAKKEGRDRLIVADSAVSA